LTKFNREPRQATVGAAPLVAVSPALACAGTVGEERREGRTAKWPGARALGGGEEIEPLLAGAGGISEGYGPDGGHERAGVGVHATWCAPAGRARERRRADHRQDPRPTPRFACT